MSRTSEANSEERRTDEVFSEGGERNENRSQEEAKKEERPPKDKDSAPDKGEEKKEEDEKKEKEGGKGEGEGEGEKPKQGFRPSKKAIVIGAIILAVIIVIGIFYWLHARQFISTDDAYTTGHVHQISSRVAGTVDKVLVDDNQLVTEGDVLVRLDPRDYEAALRKARAALQQAKGQASQATAKIGQTQAQLAAARAQVAQAQSQVSQANAQLEKAQRDYDRIAGLYSKDIKAVSKADVDAATEAFDRARSNLEGVRANLLAAEAQAAAADANVQAARADEEVAQADVASAEAQVRQAELQLSYCEVLAPVGGKVAKKTVEIGQRLQPGQALMAVVPENIWVVANLKETQLDRLIIGQRVDVEIDALDHKVFYGRVDSIQEGSGATFSLLPPDNATGNFTKIVQRVPVKIVFDPESIRDFRDKIVPGLSVVPKIDLESLKDDKREPKRQKREEKQNQAAESGK